MLRKRSYVSGILFTLVFFGSIVGFSLTTGLFLQIGLGFSAMHAALYLAAMAAGAFCGAGVGAWATSAVGRPILHVGLTIMAAGSALLYLSLRSVDGDVGLTTLAPGLFVFGLGMGMIFVPLFFDRLDLEDGGPVAAMTSGRHLVAAQDTLLMVIALVALAWLIGWLLPRRARPMV